MRTSFTAVLLLAAAVCHAVPSSYGVEPTAPASVAVPDVPVAVPAPPATAPITDSYGAPPTTAPATDSYGAPPTTAPATDASGALPTASPATDSYGAAPPTTAPATDSYGAAAPTTAPATDAYGAAPATTAPATDAYGALPTQAFGGSAPDFGLSDPLNSAPNGAAPETKLGEPVYFAPKQYKCSVSDKGFEPKEMTATKGDTVTFQMSAGEGYNIRKGKDASSCTPLDASPSMAPGAPGSSPMSMMYTVPMDAAAGKMNFYNVKGDKCSEGDMMATLNIQDNLVANTAVAGGNSTTNGTSIAGIKFSSSAASSVPMVALVGAISFVGAFVQL